ncbi:MAG: hypothetical protein CMP59_00325 [Flavobacteriales bacterium]|nr:hypothetical protein [Flavobacteriales bacterium]
MRLSSLIILFSGIMLLFACRPDEEIFDSPSAQLRFSTDSVSFDTVFTSVGTVTANIRVYNPYKERIRISSIRLNGGQASAFRINVDGSPGPTHSNVEIAGEDSMFIFIEATIDPTNVNNPFVITDFIEFVTNGNRQDVDLVAWGQNAIYFTPTSFNQNLPDFTCLTGPCSDTVAPVNVTWTKDKPYVIYGFIAIDSLDVLTIEAGARIYFHQDGGMWVYRGGTLKVMGTASEPVTFQGDRLDANYVNRPGQWDRIWINEGGQNEIHHARIRNGFIGLQPEVLPFDDPPYDPTSLLITNTIIENCSGFGMISSIYNVRAENLVISNSGQYNMVLRSAGNYDFYHCTFANYFAQAARETPSVLIQNSFVTANNTQVIGEPNVGIYNSIIYGDLENEFETEIINNGTLNLDFRSLILKTTQNTSDTTQFKNIIRNPANMIFEDPSNLDFSLSENSLARDLGDVNLANVVPLDIEGNSRTADGMPDLGAYEFTP